MKIMKVIHGYPPSYNAGSEVYSQTLCRELSQRHDVHVFTREENPFLSDYALQTLEDKNDRVTKHTINLPVMRQRYRYEHDGVDVAFEEILRKVCPDIIHVGHLNHLSLSLLEKTSSIPVVFTLHDYWLMCPRGQLIQRNPKNPQEIWKVCDGPESRKCAERCYSGYFSGDALEYEEDVTYWARWVGRRQKHVQKIFSYVNMFIAPSWYLLGQFQKHMPFIGEKITYLDYGFDLSRFQNCNRSSEKEFVFGYIGTHTIQKGIHILLKALESIEGSWRLRIWGRERPEVTPSLKQLTSILPVDMQEKIEWISEYNNQDIMTVFNQVDCIVVPSIWVENSPLVIHEAQQVGVPVITANVGGMAEFVHHEVNGLLFDFCDHKSLAHQMQRFVNDPYFATTLGKKRYLYSDNGDVPSIQDHVIALEKIYARLIGEAS
jgi:glycosyltransferase involved in cell wall biosynthesis